MSQKRHHETENKRDPIGTCRTNCIFFPQEPNEILGEYYDEFGIKYRKVKRYCSYDGSLINSWGKQCPRDIERRLKKEKAKEEVKNS